MPIENRDDLRYYLEHDLIAHGLTKWTFVSRFKRPEIFYQRVLRRVEYCQSTRGPLNWIVHSYLRFRLLRLSVALGISIPPRVFGPGLSIGHYGSIVVHSQARIGAYCRIHSATNIGASRGNVPTLGDHVYVAPGAVIYGGITVGDRAVIGANAVVGRDVDAGVTVAGTPARVIAHRDSRSVMPAFIPFPDDAPRD
jgi:serine O-acetyltransferase